MTGILLDTSILSAFAADKPIVPGEVRSWMLERSGALHVSAITFLELAQGARDLQRAGASARADRLSAWLDRLSVQYGRRVIGLDTALARTAGALADRAVAIGRHPGLADIVIGATALQHSLTLATRNVRHFEPLGVEVLDPFVLVP